MSLQVEHVGWARPHSPQEVATAESKGRGRSWMILPSLACQARCSYCFGPNHGPTMPAEVLEAAVAWMEGLARPGERIDLTFHGGEPLLAGHAWYERHLPLLRQRLGSRLRLQSNLWLLDDAYCDLFREYGVGLGTSLDGPQPINDAQRGEGYSVDSNRRCCGCPLRYICGGFCRAWGATDDPDDAPGDCMALRRRAGELLRGAVEALGLSLERWRQAGLPDGEAEAG